MQYVILLLDQDANYSIYYVKGSQKMVEELAKRLKKINGMDTYKIYTLDEWHKEGREYLKQIRGVV